MKIAKVPDLHPLGENRLIGLLLLVPGVAYDLSFVLLRAVLKYVIPFASLCIVLFLLFGVWLDMDRDTSATSNAVTVMLVTLSALGFTWASAIPREDPDYPPVMAISKQLMNSSISLILATGFKFALVHIPPVGFLPMDGKTLRFCLWLIMFGLFTQAMMEAMVPMLKFYNLLTGKGTYLPGFTLLQHHLPGTHARLTAWLRKHGSSRMPDTPRGAAA